MKISTQLVLLTVFLLLFTPFVYAEAVPTAAGGSTTLVEIGTASGQNLITASAHAGNISSLNIDSDAETNHWAGFIGNISGTVGLTGGLSNSLFEFSLTAAAVDGLAATADTNFDWSSLQVIDNGTVDSKLNLGTDAPDSLTQGWDDSAPDWLTVSGGPTIYLNDHLAAQNETWSVTVLSDSASPSTTDLHDITWIANATIRTDGTEYMSFNNDRTAEYQMIVGVNNTADLSSDEQIIYNFWIIDN